MKWPKDPRRRTAELNRRLAEAFPDATCPLRHASAFELLVAVILSAQCTDERVNTITPELFRKFPGPKAFADADKESVVQAIFSASYPGSKAGYIQQMSRQLLERFGGEVPSTMDELTQLPGVGRKTANCVLGNWYGQSALMTDTHFIRLTQRIGLTRNKDPEKIERDIMPLLPESEWTMFSHRLILHGRRVCIARKPACEKCCATDLCEYFETTVKPAAAPPRKRTKGE